MGRLSGDFPNAKSVDTALKRANKAEVDVKQINKGLANKTDDSVFQSAIRNLQNQINEIIAPTTQDSEVQNARVGVDGTDYETLKDRLDSEATISSENIGYVDDALSKIAVIGKERITDDLFGIDGYIQYTEGHVIWGDSASYRRTDFIRVYKGQKIEWELATDRHVAYMLLLKEPDFTSEVLDYGKELTSELIVKSSTYEVVDDGYIVISSITDSSSWYAINSVTNTLNEYITYVDESVASFELNNGVLVDDTDFGVDGYIQYANNKVTWGDSDSYCRTGFIHVHKGQKILWRLTTNKHVAYMLLLKEPDFRSEVLDYGKEQESESIEKYSLYTAVDNGYIVISSVADSSSWYIINPVVDHHKICLEGGNFSSETYYSFRTRDYIDWRRTAYRVFVNGAKMIRFRQPNYVNKVTFRFFDEEGIKIESKLSEWKYQSIPDDTSWIEFELEGKADVATVEFVGEKSMSVSEEKRIQRNFPSEKLTYKVSDKLFDTSRLMLPPNYDYNGAAVPLILWLDGSGNFTTWDAEISQVKVPYLQYLNNEGFAVMSVFSWGYNLWYDITGLGNAHPYVLPTNLECIKKCIEYVCDRYNVDSDQIHIMSKSQGGQVALYYASNNEINAKTVGMFAPVLDYFSMTGEAMYKGSREGIARCLGLEGDVDYYISDEYYTYSERAKTFLLQNLDKFCRLNSAWANLVGGTLAQRFEDSWQDGKKYWEDRYWEHTDRTDIYNNDDYSKSASVPVMIWGAADDDNTPYLKMAEVVEQLKNGGSEAYLKTLPNNTGRHSAADVSTINVVSGTTALGIPYVDIPVGWVENVAFIRQHSPEIGYDESRW